MKIKVKNIFEGRIKGVSLVVLVITILVLTILASTVIISTYDTSIISETLKSVLKSDLSTMQDMASVYMSNNYEDVEMGKQYLITQFGITDEKFKQYESLVVVKDGKVYVRPSAPENLQEVARELNVLIESASSSTGSIILDKQAVALKIYGNSIQNGTPSVSTPVAIESVGDKTNNVAIIESISGLQEQNGVYTTTRKDNAASLKMKFQFQSQKGNYFQEYTPTISQPGRYSITITAPTEKWYNIRLANSGRTTESSIYFDLPYDKYGGKQVTISFTLLDVNVETFSLKDIQIEEGSAATKYEPVGYKIPVTMTSSNLWKNSKTKYENNQCFKTEGGGFVFNRLSQVGTLYAMGDSISLNVGEKLTFSVSKSSDSETASLYLYKDEVYGQVIASTSGDTLEYTASSDTTIIPAVIVDSSSNYVNVNNISVKCEGKHNSQTINIYLNEPLRKLGTKVDYIDCTTGDVIRYINVKDTTGTKNMFESFEVLSTPAIEKATVQTINFENVENIFVNTTVAPSNIEVEY